MLGGRADTASSGQSLGIISMFDFRVRDFLIVVSVAAGIMFYLDYNLAYYGANTIAELTAITIVFSWMSMRRRFRISKVNKP